MALFCAAIARDSDSLLRFPFRNHVQVFSLEISPDSHLKYPSSFFFSFLFLSSCCSICHYAVIVMAYGIRTGDPRGFNKGHSSKFREGSRVQQTHEEGRMMYRPKRCGNNNKDEDNSPKTLNDIAISVVTCHCLIVFLRSFSFSLRIHLLKHRSYLLFLWVLFLFLFLIHIACLCHLLDVRPCEASLVFLFTRPFVLLSSTSRMVPSILQGWLHKCLSLSRSFLIRLRLTFLIFSFVYACLMLSISNIPKYM